MHHTVAPVLSEPWNLRQHIGEAGGHQDAASGDAAAVGQCDGEPQVPVGRRGSSPGRDDLAVDHASVVLAHLFPAPPQHLERRGAVEDDEAVHGLRGRVPWGAAVDHNDRPARPGEDQRTAEARSASADHHHVDDPLGQ
ncbi:hypothetical protein GCM10027414_34030 [Humibacter ginsengiterrae]